MSGEFQRNDGYLATGAAREAFRLAREKRCSFEEHVALEAIVSLTALYWKLGDYISHAQVAERARLHRKNAAAAIRSLAAKEIIEYRPGSGKQAGGTGIPSWIGLLERGASAAPGADQAPLSEGEPIGEPEGEPKGEPEGEPLTRARDYTEREDRERTRERSTEKGKPSPTGAAAAAPDDPSSNNHSDRASCESCGARELSALGDWRLCGRCARAACDGVPA